MKNQESGPSISRTQDVDARLDEARRRAQKNGTEIWEEWQAVPKIWKSPKQEATLSTPEVTPQAGIEPEEVEDDSRVHSPGYGSLNS